MRNFARTSFGLLGLGLIAPMVASAQAPSSSYAPAGYQPASAPATAPVGLDGQPVPAAPVAPSAPVAPAEAPHQHKGKTLCAKCAAKQAANMPPGTVVICEHMKNGVCKSCQAVLNMPGPFTVMSKSAPAAAPGRAVVSGSPSSPAMAARSAGTVAAPYDGASGDPMPVGVVQANFSQNGPMGTPMAGAPAGTAASAPGRAVAQSDEGPKVGHTAYQTKSTGFPRPHIIGHLLGLTGIGAERAEERANKKAEAHAMISYDNTGAPLTPVEDLPASAVYGKKR